MENKLAADFLSEFDESRYPLAFIARYEAMECLSSGPDCETLLVRERAGGRLLIAKCYEPGHPLFESTEPEQLRGLSHPGLPSFAGELRSAGMRCILREYVHGRTLWALKQDTAFPPEIVWRIAMELCGILKYLHGLIPPVIHRDIKPQNVVMRADGSPALIDLGISRLYIDGARSDTVFCGTQDFAPPEQYGFMQTDCRSDIYSLGILLSWLLNGKAEPIHAPQTQLERVIAKCCAFSPDDRFQNAASVQKALLKIRPSAGRRRKRLVAGVLTVLVLLVFSLLHWGAAGLLTPLPSVSSEAPGPTSESGFTEPVIEQAVRLMLGKGAEEPLSPEELASVTELYITRDVPCADIQSFFRLHEQQNKDDFDARGSVGSLEDVKLLPQLRILCVASEQIRDLSPLTSLPNLLHLELRCNAISDVTPLAGLQNLALLGLNSNPVADISPLAACASLRSLDLCNASDYDGSAIALLGDFDFLDISNATDSFMYLGGKTVTELKLSRTALTDLALLNGVAGMKRLELSDTGPTDLSGLINHTDLTYLNLSGVPAEDYTVLLKLPSLETVVVDADAKMRLEAVAAQGAFTVIYQ